MKYRKISELTSVVTGGTPSTAKNEYWDNGDIPWLQSGCCQNCYVNKADKFITKLGYDNSSAKMMPKDTIMIALTGATAGKIGYLNFEACGNQSITGILPSNNIYPKFLFYYLQSKRDKILSDCIGGAQPHISQGYVKDLLVPFINVDKQKELSKTLDNISNIIGGLKRKIELLDELVKARFVEMFDNKFESVKLGKVINTTSGGTPSKSHKEYYENGDIPWLTSGEVNAGVIENPKNYITELGVKNSSAKLVPANSVVIAMYGATAGVVGIIKYETTTNQAVCCLLPSSDYLPEYLYFATKMNKEWMISQCKGGGQLNISQAIIKDMDIINAPLNKQKDFVEFFKQVDKSKNIIQKQINETQKLFDSLMQQYFE